MTFSASLIFFGVFLCVVFTVLQNLWCFFNVAFTVVVLKIKSGWDLALLPLGPWWVTITCGRSPGILQIIQQMPMSYLVKKCQTQKSVQYFWKGPVTIICSHSPLILHADHMYAYYARSKSVKSKIILIFLKEPITITCSNPPRILQITIQQMSM